MRFLADFQAVRDGDRITVSHKHALGGGVALGVLRPGAEVTLDDAEGHTARATIASVEGNLIRTVIDWSSWRDESDVGISHHFDGAVLYRGHRSQGADVATGKQGTSAVHAPRIYVGVAP